MFIFPLEICVYRLMFTFRGGKGTLHAGVVEKVQMSRWQSEELSVADNTETGFRQEKAQDSSV